MPEITTKRNKAAFLVEKKTGAKLRLTDTQNSLQSSLMSFAQSPMIKGRPQRASPMSSVKMKSSKGFDFQAMRSISDLGGRTS